MQTLLLLPLGNQLEQRVINHINQSVNKTLDLCLVADYYLNKNFRQF